MSHINRAAVVIKPAQPCLDWINSQPPGDAPVRLQDVAQDNTVYLVPAECDTLEEAMDYLRLHAKAIFENQLFEWHEDPKTWPKLRDWNTFQKWFTIEVHSAVVDLDGGELETVED